MKRFLRENGGLLVAAAVLLTLLLFIVSSILGKNPLTDVMQVITTPVRVGSAAVSQFFQTQYDRLTAYDQLLEDYEKLKQEYAQLQEDALEGVDAIRENERLKSLLELSQERPELVYASATVTARNVTNWANTLSIDSGTNQGVAVHDCVIDQYGNLVGTVTEVGANWAIVTTILDPDTQIGGRIARTDDDAIVEGDFALMLEGKTKLSYLPQDTQLMSGDQVTTSGLGGMYPGDLLVGTIQTIYTEADGLNRYGVITPAADLPNIRYLYIITDFGQQPQ